jgi:hypothetical protein
MICQFCGIEFPEEVKNKECSMCLLANGCKFVKCPNCGYEIPAESKSVKKLFNWRKNKNEIKRNR